MRLAAACFLQAVHDVIAVQRILKRGSHHLTPTELEIASAIPWLLGKPTPGLSRGVVIEATHIDVRRLYTVPYEQIVREMRLRKSGRRKREDYA